MKTGRLSALAAAMRTMASLKCRAWACRPASLVLLAGALILCAMPESVLGNLFVTDPSNNGTIGEYTNSGATVNASLITGLSDPESIAVSGGFLYVTNPSAGTVGKYTTSGETINASLISGVHPADIEASGNDLYITDFNGPLSGFGSVGKYTTSGATINASLIPGLLFPYALAISGTNLFVANAGTIDEYTTSGLPVKTALVKGDLAINDVEISGSSLFIAYSFGDDGTVGKYNIDGKAINPHLIVPSNGFADNLAVSGTDVFVSGGGSVSKFTTSGMIVADPLTLIGLQYPFGIAIDDSTTVPETLSTLWFGVTTAGLLGFARLVRVRHGRSPESHIKDVPGNKHCLQLSS
jgi:hypothetical protein